MNAFALYQYLDALKSNFRLEDLDVFVSEKNALFGARKLNCCVSVSSSNNLKGCSLVLCPEPVSRSGEEIVSILGCDYGEKN